MPTVSFVERYSLAPAVLFAFFRRPANVVALAPADYPLRLVEGPDAPVVGQRFVVEVKRFGLSKRIETEIVTFDEPLLLVERQVQGPFRTWSVSRRFAEAADGTELTEVVTFEPPGGMLGLMMSSAAIEAELKRAYEGRAQRVLAKLNGA